MESLGVFRVFLGVRNGSSRAEKRASVSPCLQAGAVLSTRALPQHVQPGGAVQIVPMKSMLKVLGTKRLKLKHDRLLSSFAFNFNWRRYNQYEEAALLFGGAVQAGSACSNPY